MFCIVVWFIVVYFVRFTVLLVLVIWLFRDLFIFSHFIYLPIISVTYVLCNHELRRMQQKAVEGKPKILQLIPSLPISFLLPKFIVTALSRFSPPFAHVSGLDYSFCFPISIDFLILGFKKLNYEFFPPIF